MPTRPLPPNFADAVAAIRKQISAEPDLGLILGSGLSSLADAVEDATALAYGDIPGFPVPSVEGHAGRLVIGWLEGKAVAVLQGRVHYYEGRSMAEITLPVRVLQLLGVRILMVTNAAGGLRPGFQPGDVMLISDHINLVGLGGQNPLRGPNLDQLGPRFPDMTVAYDPDLRKLAGKVAGEAGLIVHEGVYAFVAGPNYETPAELRYLRQIGADAVGMSTVPEVIAARHGSTRVLGISGITNVPSLEGKPQATTTHEEVLAAGKVLVPRMETIMRGVLGGL
jgi:purine-nucleoside phosphorylase